MIAQLEQSADYATAHEIVGSLAGLMLNEAQLQDDSLVFGTRMARRLQNNTFAFLDQLQTTTFASFDQLQYISSAHVRQTVG